jgi:hypothetical protein
MKCNETYHFVIIIVINIISIIMTSHEYFSVQALFARFRFNCLTALSDHILYLSLVPLALHLIVNLNVCISVFCRYDEFIVLVL